MQTDLSDTICVFNRKMHINLSIEKIRTVSTSSLASVIAKVVNCHVEVHLDMFKLETGQCYIVQFKGYERQTALDEEELKRVVSGFVVETIKQEQSPRDEHESQVPVEFESDGGWLI